MISDEEYAEMQREVQEVSRMLLSIDAGQLDEFVKRADSALAHGSIFHPSEWMAALPQLRQVVTHAKALRDARAAIAGTARP